MLLSDRIPGHVDGFDWSEGYKGLSDGVFLEFKADAAHVHTAHQHQRLVPLKGLGLLYRTKGMLCYLTRVINNNNNNRFYLLHGTVVMLCYLTRVTNNNNDDKIYFILPFLCNTDKKLPMDWTLTSFFIKEHTYNTTVQ